MKKILYTTIAILGFANASFSQNINTIAGGGRNCGDGETATLALISNPTGVVLDGSGNIYISDYGNNRIRKVTASTGIISTVAGTGTQGYSGDGGAANFANLSQPNALAIDGSGNIYISDYGNHRIRKVTASTGIISTVAGTGIQGYSGDGGVATSAQLRNPTALAVDSSGNIYIADSYNQRIRKVTASTGIISTVAGSGTQGYSGDGGPATSANLSDPSGVAVDHSGNIYIADAINHRIRKVTASTGIISTVAGNGINGNSGDGGPATSANLNSPRALAVDSSGNIYISDQGNNWIRKVTVSTGIMTIAYGSFIGLSAPLGIALDGSRNIYIADAGNNRIAKSNPDTGNLYTIAGNGFISYWGDGGAATSANLYQPSRLALDRSRNIYILDYGNRRIRKVTASTGIISTVAGNGINGNSGNGGPATSANLNSPTALAADDSGNIYIADAVNNKIRKVTASTGIISTVAGGSGSQQGLGDGGPATYANLYTPYGVAIDHSGNIYIAGYNSGRIRKVTASTGIISTVAGGGWRPYPGDGDSATWSTLNSPNAVALDDSGNIYIAEFGNKRIRKVTASNGIITTVAGNGTLGFSGDGGLATSAQLRNPTALAVDDSGNIYIADYGNYRIRKVTASTGIITTVAGSGVPTYVGYNCIIATSANLSPNGVAVDHSGNIYIADYGSNRIIKVNNFVNSKTTIISNKRGLCANDTINISINATNGCTYNWYKNNSTIAGTSNMLKVYANGNYNVKIIDSIGCSNTSDTVSIFDAPLPKTKISLSDTTLCLNGNVFKFIDSTKIDSGSYTRNWNFGNGNTSILSTSNQSYSTIGNYVAKLKVISNYGCMDSVTKYIIIKPIPVAGKLLGQTNALVTSTPYIYTVAQQPNHSYNWIVTNGIVVLGQSTNAAKVQWINNGNGYVKVEVTNPQGCSDTTAVATKIGNVGMNETSDINNLSLYPNPNYGSFTVGFTLKESSATKLELINMIGQQVWISIMQLQNGEQQIPINLSLSAGVYVLKISTSSGEITKQVLVK